MCELGVQTAFDLPRAEHLVDDERTVTFDYDLRIAQLLLNEPFEDSDQSGIFSDVV